MTVCLWDINSYTKARNALEPTTIYKGHTSVVGVSNLSSTFLVLAWTFSRGRTLTGIQRKKTYLQASAMTSCFSCVYTHQFWSPLCIYLCIACHARWDTRSPAEPTMKVQAHDREILACAFNPAQANLLITGSADKVGPRDCFSSCVRVPYPFLDHCPARHS